MKSNEHIYFSGLNGLRFFAALAVVVTHVELLKNQFLCENVWRTNKMVFEAGPLGVIFFFVLSGFLITFLLLKEKSISGTIAVKKFYVRRILRIWPLYYLIVLLGFLILPHISFINIEYLGRFFDTNFTPNFVLYLLFLPNLAFSIYAAVPHIGQSWSIGVEEQFYIIWPLIVKYAKNIFSALLVVIFLLIVMKAVVLLVYTQLPDNLILKSIKTFLAMTKMESMAIGGIGAWVLFNHPGKLKVVYNNSILIGSLILIPVIVYLTPAIIQDAMYLVYSVLFLMIILNVSGNKNSLIKLENKTFVVLGNISYGIYMYHLLVVAFVIKGLLYLGYPVNNSFFPQLALYTIVIILTLGISWLSYHFFETRFLKLKSRFTVVKSGSRL